MRPAAVRASTFATFTFDQELRGRRREYRWRNDTSSRVLRWPSIQP
jgi:hypothetical protein